MRNVWKNIVLCLFVAAVFVMPTSTMKLTGTNNKFTNEINQGKVAIIHCFQPTVEWSKTYGGTNWDIPLGGVKQTTGGYIIGGLTESYGAGSRDVWLIKTDTTGNKLWDITYGREHCDCGWIMDTTTDDGYIIGAHGRWEPDMDDTSGWLIKVDGNGNKEWDSRFGGASGEEYFFGIQQISDGYIITGGTESYGAGDFDLWLLKTDNNGNEIWNKTYGGAELDGGYSLQQINDGGFIIIGSTDSFGAGKSDFWLIKTDSQGNKEWDKTYGGSEEDRGKTVYQTTDGGYILAGNTKSFGGNGETWVLKVDNNGNEKWNALLGGCRSVFGAMWDVWSGTTILYPTSDDGFVVIGNTKISFTNYDIWVAKIDSQGNKEWVKTFGGSNTDEAWGVEQTKDGGYIVTGATKSYGEGNYDIWLVKLTSFENERPNKPATPSGPSRGNPDQEYTFSTSTTDPDSDQLMYKWDWGDGNYSDWLDTPEASYTWTTKANFEVRVMAQDEHGGESVWSDSLPFSTPKSRTITPQILQFLKNHPNLFPILRQILSFLG